jgi:uncharacterized protein (TIGR02300 family)
VAKSEWGVKRVCQSCAAKFYDLNRSPITCPKCAAPFDPDALLKSRRSRPAPAKAAKPEPRAAADKKSKKPPEDDVEIDEDGDEAAATPTDDKNDDTLLQDTSDLGGDDVSEVAVTKTDD